VLKSEFIPSIVSLWNNYFHWGYLAILQFILQISQQPKVPGTKIWGIREMRARIMCFEASLPLPFDPFSHMELAIWRTKLDARFWRANRKILCQLAQESRWENHLDWISRLPARLQEQYDALIWKILSASSSCLRSLVELLEWPHSSNERTVTRNLEYFHTRTRPWLRCHQTYCLSEPFIQKYCLIILWRFLSMKMLNKLLRRVGEISFFWEI
jgi:hypothetical protein